MVVRAAVSCGRWSAGANVMQLDAAAYAFNLVGDAGGEFLVELGGIRAHTLKVGDKGTRYDTGRRAQALMA